MSLSVRRRILEALTERMKFVVKDSLILPRIGNNNSPKLDIISSGTYTPSVALGRDKFTIEVISSNQIRIVDILGLTGSSDVSPSSGVPIALGTTGISITITASGDLTNYIGDFFDLRMNNSFMTVSQVYPWFRQNNNGRLPFICVYDIRESKNTMSLERYDNNMSVMIILAYKDSNKNSDEIYQITADIENEFNRDVNLTEDDGTEISHNLFTTQVEIFGTDGTGDILGTEVLGEVNYRNAFNDARSLK